MGNIYLTKEEAQLLFDLVSKELDNIETRRGDIDKKRHKTYYAQSLERMHDNLLDHIEE